MLRFLAPFTNTPPGGTLDNLKVIVRTVLHIRASRGRAFGVPLTLESLPTQRAWRPGPGHPYERAANLSGELGTR